ncbi:MAG: hypothetical protein JOZ99_03720 [Actinobacteria bacterium]|nr:hypothetical protein [Actinomycetota bacterium]
MNARKRSTTGAPGFDRDGLGEGVTAQLRLQELLGEREQLGAQRGIELRILSGGAGQVPAVHVDVDRVDAEATRGRQLTDRNAERPVRAVRLPCAQGRVGGFREGRGRVGAEHVGTTR